MSEQEQVLKKQYIYEVIRWLPRDQRKEISMELEELIDDMYESGKQNMDEILTQLGDPKKFAKKYINFNHYLIGPSYFDNYIWILKIVVLCVGISSLLSGFFTYNYNNFNLFNFLIDVIVNLSVSMVGAFGMLTLIFAIMEYFQVKLEFKKEASWSVQSIKDSTEAMKNVWIPSSLSPIPNKHAVISRGSTLTGVLFLVVLGVLFLFNPEIFGVIIYENKQIQQTIPLFNLDRWNIICPILLLSLLVNFIDEIFRLVTGCYCKMVMISNLITNAIQLFLLTMVFKFLPVWNSNFTITLSRATGETFSSKGDLLHYWGTDLISNIVVGIIFISILIDSGITIYKSVRYGGAIK